MQPMKLVNVLLLKRFQPNEASVLSNISRHTKLPARILKVTTLLLLTTVPALTRMKLLTVCVLSLTTMLLILRLQLLLISVYLLKNVGVILRNWIFTLLTICPVLMLLMMKITLPTFPLKTFDILLLYIHPASKLRNMNASMLTILMMTI